MRGDGASTVIAATWSDAALVFISATAGIVGSYIGGRIQRNAQRADRREAREDSRRERRETDLRALQSFMSEAQVHASRQVKAKYTGTDVDPADIEAQLLSVANMHAATARAGDRELTKRVQVWTAALIEWVNVAHGITERDRSITTAVGTANAQVNQRIGELFADLDGEQGSTGQTVENER